MPLPVILDVDTGADDALALLLALRSPALDVRAITCVAGNHTLVNVVANTLKILDVLDAPAVPVAAGMQQPLLEQMHDPFLLHGHDGMADLQLPASARPLVDVHAVELLRKTIETSTEPVTIIALAPLTNLALFLRQYPATAAKAARIVSMGGTFRAIGNTSPAGEFNVRQDPEAAAIVLESGLPVCLYPLDPFRQIFFNRREIDQFLDSLEPAAHVAGRIMQHMVRFFDAETSLIGDAGTVAAVIDPDGATVERHPITVEVAGPATRGLTLFDRRPAGARSNPNPWWQTSTSEIDVIVDVDAERYRALFRETLGVTG